MSVSRASSSGRIFLVALTASGFLAAATLPAQGPVGQESDGLDQTRRLNEVAAQKVESEVRAALRQVEQLLASNPAKALQRLQLALTQVEDATTLSEKRRQALKRLLQDRIRVAAATAADAAQQTRKPADKQSPAADPRAAAGQRWTSQERIFQLREAIQKWQKEAGRLAAQTAAERTKAAAERLAENRQLQSERAQRSNEALRAVDKTARVPQSDFELPPNWQARTRNRKGSNDVPLTAKEKAILRALDSTLSVSFKNSRFEDVIEYLQTVTGLPIIVWRTALEETGVTYDTPVTLQVRNVSLRSLLRKILGDLGLAYVIKDEAVQVVTAQQAREMLVVRVHYIGDLLLGGELARCLQAARLIELITSTIEPQSWEVHGGPGKIYYDDARRSLVIKQSAELQPVLSSGLH